MEQDIDELIIQERWKGSSGTNLSQWTALLALLKTEIEVFALWIFLVKAIIWSKNGSPILLSVARFLFVS